MPISGIIGIIANPVAGKDIRRLVAYASLTGNREKIDLVRRVILGADSTGIEQILLMPEYSMLCSQAIEGIGQNKLQAQPCILDMNVTGTQDDSTRAAQMMAGLGAGCIVAIGGDGTCRAVAKGDRTVPLVAISTGTNNVFPQMVEATVAGIAAGVVAKHAIDVGKTVRTQKRIIVSRNGRETDMALVDVAVLDQEFVGARAVWSLAEMKALFCTRAQPDTIGLSSIGGSVCAVSQEEDCGLAVYFGKGKLKVRAAVLPGVIQTVEIREYRKVPAGEETPVPVGACLLALDGEREFKVDSDDRVTLRIEHDGPRLVDVSAAVGKAAAAGFFRENPDTERRL